MTRADDPPAPRDPFGRLLADPAELSQRDRIDALRRLAGRLQAGSLHEDRWLGTRLSHWLSAGGDLARVLDVRPPRGSRRTAQRVVQQEARDRALLRLAVAAGSDRRALRLLRGEATCPPELRDLLSEAQRLGVPAGDGAVWRARRRVAPHGR